MKFDALKNKIEGGQDFSPLSVTMAELMPLISAERASSRNRVQLASYLKNNRILFEPEELPDRGWCQVTISRTSSRGDAVGKETSAKNITLNGRRVVIESGKMVFELTIEEYKQLKNLTIGEIVGL